MGENDEGCTEEVAGATFCGAFQARERGLSYTTDLMDSPWKVLTRRVVRSVYT